MCTELLAQQLWHLLYLNQEKLKLVRFNTFSSFPVETGDLILTSLQVDAPLFCSDRFLYPKVTVHAGVILGCYGVLR